MRSFHQSSCAGSLCRQTEINSLIYLISAWEGDYFYQTLKHWSCKVSTQQQIYAALWPWDRKYIFTPSFVCVGQAAAQHLVLFSCAAFTTSLLQDTCMHYNSMIISVAGTYLYLDFFLLRRDLKLWLWLETDPWKIYQNLVSINSFKKTKDTWNVPEQTQGE